MTRTLPIRDLREWEVSPSLAQRVLVGVLGLREGPISEDTELSPHELLAITLFTWLWRQDSVPAEMAGPIVKKVVADLQDKIEEIWEHAADETAKLPELRFLLLNERIATWSGCEQGVDVRSGAKVDLPRQALVASTLNLTLLTLSMNDSAVLVREHA